MEATSLYYIKIKLTDDIDMPEMHEEVKTILTDVKDSIVMEEFEECEILLLFLYEYKVKELIKCFEKYDVLLEYKEITYDVLMGKIKSELITENCEEYMDKKFDSLMGKFLNKNLNIDTVLDKINEKGIKSLTDIDKAILKKA